MSVNLIFKIAAVGILVSVLGQILKQRRTGGACVFDRNRRAGTGTVLAASIYQSAV